MNNLETVIYLAGIIDGEGCIGMEHLAPRGKSRKKDYYLTRLTVINTSKMLMDLLVGTFKGQYDTRKKIEGRKICYRWHVFGKDQENALIALMPYLRIKKQQAELVMEYRKTVNDSGWLISDETLAQRKELWLKCKHFNTVGD